MPSQNETLAHGALAEITGIETIGAFVDESDVGDGVATLRFETAQPGYRGWLWTVSVASVDGAEPTVLEAELLPSDGALLAPEWVPWSERLAEYEASQDAAASVNDTEGDDPDDDEAFADDESDDEDDDLDDLEDDEDDDLNDDDSDLDGLDIDEINELDELDDDDADDDDDDEADDDDDDLDDEPEPASLER